MISLPSSAGFLCLAVLLVLQQSDAAESSSAWREFPLPGQSAAEESKGREVYLNSCEVCHGAGVGKPGTEALRVKYGGRLPAVLTDRTDLSPGLIRTAVRQGISMMPFYRKTELSDADLAALEAFLSRSNEPTRRSEPGE